MPLAGGTPIPPVARVRVMNDGAFEGLIQIWLSQLKIKRGYLGVLRFGGAGDMGRDVIGWTTDKKCEGIWDNIQCKHHTKPLAPTDLWPEIGKVLWHAWKKDYALPRKAEFVCSSGIGTTAKHLLTNPTALRDKLLVQHVPAPVLFGRSVARVRTRLLARRDVSRLQERHR